MKKLIFLLVLLGLLGAGLYYAEELSRYFGIKIEKKLNSPGPAAETAGRTATYRDNGVSGFFPSSGIATGLSASRPALKPGDVAKCIYCNKGRVACKACAGTGRNRNIKCPGCGKTLLANKIADDGTRINYHCEKCKIDMDEDAKCPACNGEKTLKCDKCFGSGLMQIRGTAEAGTSGFAAATVQCPRCSGTGFTQCLKCEGDGIARYSKCAKCGKSATILKTIGQSKMRCAYCGFEYESEALCDNCNGNGKIKCMRCGGSGMVKQN